MKRIIITQENSKQRIDKFLVRELFFSGMTRGEIIRNINSGSVLVNGHRTKPSHMIKENEEIKIDIKKEDTRLTQNEKVKLEIIYIDRNIIAINKPAGLQVHPVKLEQDTLVNGLLAKFPEIKNITDGSKDSKLRPGIVHRLDIDTSGVMIVARNQNAFEELKKLFRNRKVEKEYLAIVFGKLRNKKGAIEKPIARSQNYKKQTIASFKTKTKIRPAVTEYEVLKEYKNYSLVKALPRTGRMHQIRVHLAALGHPVVGDKKYMHKSFQIFRNAKRQLLHASQLEFEIFGKRYSFKSSLPADFSQFIKSLDPAPIPPELN
jgi:23S rRNA pseudouridine1911/1915/1917 synthase